MNAKELNSYALEQLRGLDGIRSIPMMGGYVFYYNDRIFGGIYEPGFMVKITKASERYMPNVTPLAPYDGAKPLLPAEIIDDSEAFCQMVSEMYEELPEKKASKKRSR